MSIHEPSSPASAAMDTAPYVTTSDFADVVEGASGLAVVDFTAAWCPPCRMMGPHVDALARELAPRTVVVKVDADDQAGLAARFGVMSLPTLLFFRGGRVIDRVVGALPPDRLRARVRELSRAGTPA
jgi:thioredoxin 1